MKKGILLTIALATMALFTNAQDNIIPNGGFDDWTSQTAIPGWGFNGGVNQGTQVNLNTQNGTVAITPHNGSGFLVLQNTTTLGIAQTTFATTERPTSLEGAFIRLPQGAGTDRFRVYVTLSKWDSDSSKRDTIMNAVVTGAQGQKYPWEYIQLDLSGLYLNSDIPDTCVVTIFAGYTVAGTTTFAQNTSLFVDALKLNSHSVGVSPIAKTDLGIKNYPNPVSSKTTISYNVTTFSNVDVTITDITGKNVATVFSGEQTQGRQEVEFDATALKPGIYFYTVRVGSAVETKKFVVTR